MTEWILKNKKAEFDVSEHKVGLSKVICRVLVNRGVTTPEQIRAYLNPKEVPLHDASLLKNAGEAAKRLWRAVCKKRRIRIIGDYDVDGIMATFLLYKVLHVLGAEADYRIPDRIKDGYGMNMRMVEEAEQDHIALLLTCDNGIAAMEPIARAGEAGMEVIVTDHHEISCSTVGEQTCYELPSADVIVNPKQPGETYPQKGICGAMVAYKVVCLLLKEAEGRLSKEEREELLTELLVPVAFATICDVMELTGENRAVVAKGLALAGSCDNQGIRALLQAYELEDKKLSAYHAGFLIGPCFNAAGRLDTALLGLELLLCEDETEAKKRAAHLKELNDTRKEMTLAATRQAEALAEAQLAKTDAQVLVLYLPECHESLAGIVAGRIREKFYRPTVVLTKGEYCVKGSARSIEGYSMFEKLSEQKELLLAFGGHPMAAGLSLPEENVSLLAERLNEAAGLTQEELTPKLYLDAVLPFAEITEDLMGELERLEPFGNGNPKPVFASSGVTVSGIRRIGKDGNSMRLQLTDTQGISLTGLFFQDADGLEDYLTEEFGADTVRELYRGRRKIRLTLAFSPGVDEYRGEKNSKIFIEKYKKFIIST
ncbi:MAG: single-stranded-DNA-specific exonuclease RecJ [Lachnospiraceae bacterium]|nr:single-stranded-DNA-specific exonuclease RecJ [Lachnospiraceae bacterium]